MKKWIGLFTVIALVAAGWYYARTNWRITPTWMQAKTALVTRGDIRVPITAAGLIEPRERIEIKSKASGEVTQIHIKEGDFVKKGDALITLDKSDEERSVDRAKATLKRMQAQHASALVAVAKAEQTVLQAAARVAELEANGLMTQFEVENQQRFMAQGSGAERDLLFAQARNKMNQAQLDAARATLESAKAAIDEAKQAVQIGEANVEDANKALEDAEQRLSETTILAPGDALVTDVPASVGQLVQSGESAFTGGTPVALLADISKLMVVARVDEADYGRVLDIAPQGSLPEISGLREAALESAEQMQERSGVVTLVVDAFPEEEFEGRIERVEPQGKLNQGAAVIQYDVHIEITDRRRYKLPLGTQAQVEFTVESVTDALLVPAEAVKTYQGDRGVFVKTRPTAGEAEPRPKFIACRFGITDGSHTQLIAAIGDEELREGLAVYTKLPRDWEEQQE